MDENIFDFNTLTDEQKAVVQEQIKSKKMPVIYEKILELFTIKSELSVEEVLIALMKIFEKKFSRANVYNYLNRMKKQNLLSKVEGKSGTYKLTEQ